MVQARCGTRAWTCDAPPRQDSCHRASPRGADRRFERTSEMILVSLRFAQSRWMNTMDTQEGCRRWELRVS
jgi:hypothetical protein